MQAYGRVVVVLLPLQVNRSAFQRIQRRGEAGIVVVGTTINQRGAIEKTNRVDTRLRYALPVLSSARSACARRHRRQAGGTA